MFTFKRGFTVLALLTLCYVWSCGSTTTDTPAPANPLLGQWVGQNSTNKCLPTGDACYSAKFTVTFTADQTYSITSDDGGAATGTFTNTTTKITTELSTITSDTGVGCTISFIGVNGGVTSPTVLAGGSGYTVGQVLLIAGGTEGQVAISAVTAGAVTSVTLISSGSGYTNGTVTGAATSLEGLKRSACFTNDFLNGVTYTLSPDGKTLTIPVCPITLTKQ